jgi:DNA-binding Lrp family transcriptional regulator
VLYFDADFDPQMLGLGVRTVLWLLVEPAQLATVGAALAEHPEVAFAAATTGPTNVHASVHCGTVPALYTYLTTQVAALPGIQRVETTPVIRTIKGAGTLPMRPPRD